MIPPKPSSAPLTPAQKSAITKAKNKANKAARAAEEADFWKLYDAEDFARYDDIKKTQHRLALEHHRLMNLPRKPATPIPTKPRKQLQLEYPSPAERPPPKFGLSRTKNDITGRRNNALRAAGEASRANPGESRHQQYLLEHEGVRVRQGRFTAPVVPPSSRTKNQSTIRKNWERVAPKQESRPAPKPKPMKPYTPTSVLTGIPKPRPRPAWGYGLGRPMGQLALFPNADIPKPGEVPWTPPPKPPSRQKSPKPTSRQDPPWQTVPVKSANTGKGRLVPTPKSDIKISGSTTYKRIPNGTRGALRGAKGFGGGALGVLAGPLIYGTAFGIKERSFSGFLKGLDIWAGGGKPSRGPDA